MSKEEMTVNKDVRLEHNILYYKAHRYKYVLYDKNKRRFLSDYYHQIDDICDGKFHNTLEHALDYAKGYENIAVHKVKISYEIDTPTKESQEIFANAFINAFDNHQNEIESLENKISKQQLSLAAQSFKIKELKCLLDKEKKNE